MPASVTKYDPELLASAPEATKAQLQSGYAAHLLDGRDYPIRPTVRPGDPEAGRAHSEAGPASSGDEKAPRPSFYRTRRGVIIIIVAFVASVAVIVGGAVGGVKSRPGPTGPVQGVGTSPQTTPSSATLLSTGTPSLPALLTPSPLTLPTLPVPPTLPPLPTPPLLPTPPSRFR